MNILNKSAESQVEEKNMSTELHCFLQLYRHHFSDLPKFIQSSRRPKKKKHLATHLRNATQSLENNDLQCVLDIVRGPIVMHRHSTCVLMLKYFLPQLGWPVDGIIFDSVPTVDQCHLHKQPLSLQAVLESFKNTTKHNQRHIDSSLLDVLKTLWTTGSTLLPHPSRAVVLQLHTQLLNELFTALCDRCIRVGPLLFNYTGHLFGHTHLLGRRLHMNNSLHNASGTALIYCRKI